MLNMHNFTIHLLPSCAKFSHVCYGEPDGLVRAEGTTTQTVIVFPGGPARDSEIRTRATVTGFHANANECQ